MLGFLLTFFLPADLLLVPFTKSKFVVGKYNKSFIDPRGSCTLNKPVTCVTGKYLKFMSDLLFCQILWKNFNSLLWFFCVLVPYLYFNFLKSEKLLIFFYGHSHSQ